MRTFIAVELSDAIKNQYSELYEAGRQSYPRLRWVSPENLHVTLRFLGDTDLESLNALREALSPLPGSAFDASLGVAGSFGPRQSPRTLWFSIGAGREQFEALAQAAETAARRAGFPRERRPWRAHVTIARNPRNIRVPDWPALGKNSGLEDASFRVSHISLVESELQPTGPIYSALWRLAIDEDESPAESINEQ